MNEWTDGRSGAPSGSPVDLYAVIDATGKARFRKAAQWRQSDLAWYALPAERLAPPTPEGYRVIDRQTEFPLRRGDMAVDMRLGKDAKWFVIDSSSPNPMPYDHWLYARPIAPPAIKEPPACMSVADAMGVLSSAMEKDSDFAWSWYCNVAMAAVDAGADPRKASQQSAEFMSRAFGVDVRKSDEWKAMESQAAE